MECILSFEFHALKPRVRIPILVRRIIKLIKVSLDYCLDSMKIFLLVGLLFSYRYLHLLNLDSTLFIDTFMSG